jgi:hypothetical protein
VKRITEALIRKHFDNLKTIRRRLLGGWLVDLESGASVKITRKGIDFGKYREIENRANINEFLFQCEFRDSIALGYEIWGGIGLYGKSKLEDRVAVLKYAESIGVDTGDQGLVLRHFGPQAEIKYNLFGGWTVSLPNGSAVRVLGGGIQEVTGGGDMFRSALRLIDEIAPGNAIIHGKPHFVLLGMNHAKGLNINAIPESDMASFYAITGVVVQFTCILLACCWLNLLAAVITGYITGLLLCMVGGRLFGKQLQARSRRLGRAMLGLETTESDTRKASKDDARKRGMLL